MSFPAATNMRWMSDLCSSPSCTPSGVATHHKHSCASVNLLLLSLYKHGVDVTMEDQTHTTAPKTADESGNLRAKLALMRIEGPQTWSTAKVLDWLDTQEDLRLFKDHFAKARIRGSHLKKLRNGALRDMGIESVGDRMTILCAIEMLLDTI